MCGSLVYNNRVHFRCSNTVSEVSYVAYGIQLERVGVEKGDGIVAPDLFRHRWGQVVGFGVRGETRFGRNLLCPVDIMDPLFRENHPIIPGGHFFSPKFSTKIFPYQRGVAFFLLPICRRQYDETIELGRGVKPKPQPSQGRKFRRKMPYLPIIF